MLKSLIYTISHITHVAKGIASYIENFQELNEDLCIFELPNIKKL